MEERKELYWQFPQFVSVHLDGFIKSAPVELCMNRAGIVPSWGGGESPISFDSMQRYSSLKICRSVAAACPWDSALPIGRSGIAHLNT